MELVERALLRRHRLVVLPRLRDHHQHGVRQAAAAELEQLEHLVEPRRVGRAGRADREGALEPVDQVALQQRLARPHPVLVAHHRVDLAVVGDHPVRVRQRPRRERVRREARVHERQRRLEALVVEVGVELAQLLRDEHALVDERAGRQRREVHRGLVLHALAGDERSPVEIDAAERRSCLRPTRGITCLNVGMASRAIWPIIESSVGTSRHATTRRSSLAAIFSIVAMTASQSAVARGRKAQPTA